MKILCVFLFGLICVTLGVKSYTLGSKECTWGPIHWCKNITNAKSCGAVKHCIQTVWNHQKLPPDGDDVCKICLDMVKQARDQLESNETQEELKEVFEGSCKLIPIKVVAEGCCKLADEFIPELVETLASEMNPQVVCSVAGLCNNAWVDQQLAAMKTGLIEATPLRSALEEGNCSNCKIVVDAMDKRLHSMSRDDVLEHMLEACGHTGSLSDGCSAIVITYFTEIYNFLQENLKSPGVCHMAGVCSSLFHTHRLTQKNIEVIHESAVGVVKPQEDLPCELCEQLIVHLRDLLVANTTEEEFEQVLQGLCKQTGTFKDECLSLVNEYYAVIYNYLVDNLNPEETCKFIGLCGKPGTRSKGPIWLLQPPQVLDILQATLTPSKIKAATLTPAIEVSPAQPNKVAATRLTEAVKLHRVPIGDRGGAVKVINPEKDQLPIERMIPQTALYVNNKEACTFCQYFLHYVQQAITSPETEAVIEKVVREACDHLPGSIESQCRDFVDTYGNAFIALLAQEIDPTLVCPALGLCPKQEVAVRLDMTHTVSDKPTCPLCLLAVQSLVNKLKDKKTEEDIRKELENLCSELPQSLAGECRNFVDSYTEQLVDMILADFTPEEICTYLKLCDPTKKKVTTPVPDILSNEIPALTSEKKELVKATELIPAKSPRKLEDSALCVICEFIISKLDQDLKNDTTQDEIKNLVKNVCNHLPKTVAAECNQFVDEYADLVIALLAQSIDPKEVCATLKLCSSGVTKHQVLLNSIKNSIKECAVCEATMGALDQLLADPNVQKNIEQLLKKVCPMVPAEEQGECKQLIDVYGPSIMNVLSEVANPQLVCMELGICNWERQNVRLLGGKKCTWGPSYWCQSVDHAKSCDTLEHCQEKVWKAMKP